MYFRNLVLSAFAISMIASLFLSLYQLFLITPIILDAEVYEVVETVGEHTDEVWTPEDGAERSSFSFVANGLICFAFALVLMSIMATKKMVKPLQGIFWGTAAYLSIFVAPALGLPPEIPGMEAAYLESRQAWWLFAVLSTAIGLWLIVFSKNILKGFGILLLLMPHILGAPQPIVHGFVNTDPEAVKALTALWHEFIIQTSLANALLWLIIGLLSAFLTHKFIHPLDYQE